MTMASGFLRNRLRRTILKIKILKVFLLLPILLLGCTKKPKYGDTYCALDNSYKKFDDRIGWKLHVDDVKNGNVHYTFIHVIPDEQVQRLAQDFAVVKKEVSLEKFNIELEKNELTSNACAELDSKYQSEQKKIKSL